MKDLTELVLFRSDPAEVSTCPSDNHGCFLLDLQKFGNLELLPALEQDIGLSKETKARVLQMVMQCSAPRNDDTERYDKTTNTVEKLVTKLRKIRQHIRACTFEERMTLLRLAREYLRLEATAKDKITQARKLRRREENLEPMKRKSAKTYALDSLVEQQSLMSAAELKAAVQDGTSLFTLSRGLGGVYAIATFPGAAVQKHDFALDFASASLHFPSLSRPITPIE